MKKRKKRTEYEQWRFFLYYAALHDFVQKIVGSLNQKEFALGVFLDIDGAFDNVSFGSMRPLGWVNLA
jgi:hypothetical protein